MNLTATADDVTPTDAPTPTPTPQPKKRAKHNQDAATASKKRGGKLRDAIANKMKRRMKVSSQRKSRVAPMSKSAARSRGNAKTRRRKESRG
jgi:hypothetical protein